METTGDKTKSVWRSTGVIIVLSFVLATGYVAGRLSNRGPASSAAQPTQPQSVRKWYCSMHPQIIRDGPGRCPICNMELVSMPADLAAAASARELVVSEDAAKLMEIQTAPVERKSVTAEIRMFGKVDFDETKVKYISAWVGGRIDRLYVDFTGIKVQKGDHLVDIYSPELISAQAELLEALKSLGSSAVGSAAFLRTSAESTLEATREKLRLLGLSAEQIKGIEESGKVLTHITIYSPIGGIVIEKKANLGMYVTTGTQIYTVADLSQVWVKLDAYESDLAWLRYGQEVEFMAEAYPGEAFKGRIVFIDPTLNPMTRTVKVRVDFPNADGKLKPEMFVRAVVKAQVAQGGMVMDTYIAGKWICPMHPSVVKTQKGACDICGMDLVTTESLGYVTTGTHELSLVIPASAPLITGKRAVVYVRKADARRPTFEGREVVLGPRAGDYYLVESGLGEGELVVISGNFKIDSSLQIQAKPSMMSPTGGISPGGHEGHAPKPGGADMTGHTHAP